MLHLQLCFSPLRVPVLGGVCYPKPLLPGRSQEIPASLLALPQLAQRQSQHWELQRGIKASGEKGLTLQLTLGEVTCWQSQVVHLAEGAGPDHDSGETICQQGAESD